jgi:hypothetical protein
MRLESDGRRQPQRARCVYDRTLGQQPARQSAAMGSLTGRRGPSEACLIRRTDA